MKVNVILSLGIALLVSHAHAGKFPQETSEAQAFIAGTAVRSQFNYCAPGTLTCRALMLLKDKSTGAPIRSFYNVFISAERAVGSTGYILQNSNSDRFHATLDSVHDGKVEIDTVFSENNDLTVTFDSKGFPTVHDVTVKVLGTTRYNISTMKYSEQEATITGVEYDSANPSYSRPYRTEYKRVH